MNNKQNNTFFRLLITPVRGGSGAFLRAFENNPNVHSVHQPIKSGLRENGTPDYSIYQLDHPVYHQYPGKFIVAKETIGPVREQCTFNPFPNESALKESKPLFMFRDPFQTWNSWRQWWKQDPKTGLNWFGMSYQHTYNLFKTSLQVSSDVTCITLEKLGKYPSKIFPLICKNWGILYDDKMLNWSMNFGENTTFTQDAKNLIDQHPALIKSVAKVIESRTFQYHSLPLNELEISPDEIQRITDDLLPSYQEIERFTETFYSNSQSKT